MASYGSNRQDFRDLPKLTGQEEVCLGNTEGNRFDGKAKGLTKDQKVATPGNTANDRLNVKDLRKLTEDQDVVRLGDYIGEGTFATVYEGWTRDDNKVAVKIISRSSSSHDKDISEEISNMKLASGHRNICTFVDSFILNNDIWLLMEHIDGVTANDLFKHCHRKLSSPHIGAILQGTISGLKHLHGLGITHRDMKEDNLMITRMGRVKIIDLGSSTRDTTDLDQCFGTSSHNAPEVLTGAAYGLSADVWSLGITTLNLANLPCPESAMVMWAATDPHWKPEISAENPVILSEFVLRCLVGDPSARASSSQLCMCDLVKSKNTTSRQHMADLVEGCWNSY